MESDDESYQNAQYLSQDEEEETTIDTRPKQQQSHTWCHKQTFESAAEAIAWVKNYTRRSTRSVCSQLSDQH